MSELQENARPILTSMIMNESIVITTEQKNLLARWATMTAMSAEFTERNLEWIGYNQIQRTYLKDTGSVPDYSSIFIGKYFGSNYGLYYNHIGTVIPPYTSSDERFMCQTTTIKIGVVVFEVISTNSSDYYNFFNSYLDHFCNSFKLIQIWPDDVSLISWDSRPALSDSTLYALSKWAKVPGT